MTCTADRPTSGSCVDVARLLQLFDSLAGFQFPVLEKRDAQRLDGRPTHANHGVDPLPDAGILLEEPRIDQVLAAGVGDLAIDDHDLAVHAQIEAIEEHTQKISRQRLVQAYAALLQTSALLAIQEFLAADGVDQYPADHASLHGAQQGLDDQVGITARGPDVKLQMHGALCGVDVGHQRTKRCGRVGNQLHVVGWHGGYAHRAIAERRQRLTSVAQRFPIHLPALVEIGHPLAIWSVNARGPLGAAASQTQLTEHQVQCCSAERKDQNYGQPCEREPNGPPAHDHAQGKAHPNEPVGDKQGRRPVDRLESIKHQSRSAALVT